MTSALVDDRNETAESMRPRRGKMPFKLALVGLGMTALLAGCGTGSGGSASRGSDDGTNSSGEASQVPNSPSSEGDGTSGGSGTTDRPSSEGGAGTGDSSGSDGSSSGGSGDGSGGGSGGSGGGS